MTPTDPYEMYKPFQNDHTPQTHLDEKATAFNNHALY